VGPVTIGIDLGQKRDPFAIAVVEIEMRGDEDHYLVRFLERLPLGTPYDKARDRVSEICRQLEERGAAVVNLYADATGQGTAFTDELRRIDIPCRPVYFTHGDRRTSVDGCVTLGKAWLVSRIKVLLQCGRLHLPKTPKAEAMREELLDYEIRISEDANERYGAFKVGTHDDLVTALGLAVQDRPPEPWLLIC
jgi:hypothetical protein